MRIIERYLLKNLLVPLIYLAISFILLYMIIDLFGRLDEIIREQVSFALIIKYYLNSLPLILTQILPFSCLVAVMYSLGNLQKYNEIMAMYASGMGIWKISRPYVTMGLALSILVLILSETVNPNAYTQTRSIEAAFEKNKTVKQKGMLDNVTLYGQDNRLIYARKYDLEKNMLYDLIILEHDKNQTLVSRITAKLGVWQRPTWKLYNVVIYKLDPKGQFVGKPDYLYEKEINLTDRPEDFLKHEFIVEAMNSRELYYYINKFKGGSEKITRRLLVDYYNKKFAPLATFVLTIMAIPFALMQNTTGKFMSLGVSFGMGMLFYGINAVSLGLGKAGILPPAISAYVIPLFFSLYGIILLKRIHR